MASPSLAQTFPPDTADKANENHFSGIFRTFAFFCQTDHILLLSSVNCSREANVFFFSLFNLPNSIKLLSEMPLHQHFMFNLHKKDSTDRPGLKQFLLALNPFFCLLKEMTHHCCLSKHYCREPGRLPQSGGRVVNLAAKDDFSSG